MKKFSNTYISDTKKQGEHNHYNVQWILIGHKWSGHLTRCPKLLYNENVPIGKFYLQQKKISLSGHFNSEYKVWCKIFYFILFNLVPDGGFCCLSLLACIKNYPCKFWIIFTNPITKLTPPFLFFQREFLKKRLFLSKLTLSNYQQFHWQH